MKVVKINSRGLEKSLHTPSVLFLLDNYNLRSLRFLPVFEKFASMISSDAPFVCLMIDAVKYRTPLSHVGYVVGDVPPICIFNNGGLDGRRVFTALNHYLGERDLLRCCSKFFRRRDRPRGNEDRRPSPRPGDVARRADHVDVVAHERAPVGDRADASDSDTLP